MAKPNRSHAHRKQPAFLAALATGTTVAGAAKAAGIDASTAYDWRRKDPGFAAAWDEAYQMGGDALEAEALRRAVVGVEEPVYWQGQVVGHVRKYSDTLLIFLLKARYPERYCESVRRAAFERKWAKEDGKPDDSTVPAEAVVALLNSLAAQKAATATA